MEDKKLNEVTTVNSNTLANVKTFLAVMKDGTIQQMSKEDLASVVGGLIGRASEEKAGLVYSDMFSFGRSCKDANEAITFGLFKLDPSTEHVPSGINYGDVLLVIPWDQNTVHQFIFTVSGNEYKRIKSNVWNEWNQR